MKLIDKDALVAEIEKRKIPFKRDVEDGYYPTYLCALMDFEDFLDTLEVKEMNLEKEIIDWWNTHYSEKDYTFEGHAGHYLENSTVIEIAKYFFELGLKAAQKGE